VKYNFTNIIRETNRHNGTQRIGGGIAIGCRQDLIFENKTHILPHNEKVEIVLLRIIN
jgi:hypothetical protein